MQERKAVETVLRKQLKVEGFFDKKAYHILVKDRETEQVFKSGKAENLRNALLCLRGTGIQYPISDSIIQIEERMKEGRFFMSWEEDHGTIFYLSSVRADEGNHCDEDILVFAVSSECKVVQVEGVVFKFYRKEDRRSVKIVASQDKKIFRSFAGLGDDIAEAAERALRATGPGYCRKMRT